VGTKAERVALGERPWRMPIDGALVEAADGSTYPTSDPATGRRLAEVPAAGAADVDRAVAAAERGSAEWRRVPVRERAGVPRRLVERSGELVPIERGGDRRVLALANPGLDLLPYAASTLWAAVQYLGGHERAPAHRHTAGALRCLKVRGSGPLSMVMPATCGPATWC
jgi:hypothetical protein